MTFQWAKDSWHSKFRTSDKWYHFFGCALIFATLWIAGLPVVDCFFLTLFAGVLVEIKDGFYADGFSWRDLIADTLGL